MLQWPCTLMRVGDQAELMAERSGVAPSPRAAPGAGLRPVLPEPVTLPAVAVVPLVEPVALPRSRCCTWSICRPWPAWSDGFTGPICWPRLPSVCCEWSNCWPGKRLRRCRSRSWWPALAPRHVGELLALSAVAPLPVAELLTGGRAAAPGRAVGLA